MYENAQAVVLTGMPGAGKTTVAELVAANYGASARLSADALQGMIRNGAVWALGEPASEARRQVLLSLLNLGMLAKNFAMAGFNPIIDCVLVSLADYNLLCEHLSPVRVTLIVLAPSASVCSSRNDGREASERFDFLGFETLEEHLRKELSGVGHWIDSEAMTAAETASLVLRHATGGESDIDQ
ncbi:AAA family ATPase [Curtobacterium sp. TXMA1]|uniref:AAA family ATPase n=1 Tax=Curtobacterium sp. TXMA1 TaxID=2876939 RepID=UPI001CCF2DC2|nr:AAA family ATPase [Curtobacterium sp. TXMA1]UBQ01861.1 ATP-binding protein [Curtobacterium sp. TXMA1]